MNLIAIYIAYHRKIILPKRVELKHLSSRRKGKSTETLEVVVSETRLALKVINMLILNGILEAKRVILL